MKKPLSLALAFLIFSASAGAQEPAQPAPPKAVEGALVAVARHLSDPYALYLYESLTRQTLSNETILEGPGSPFALLAQDTLWAQGVISKSILVDRADGPSLDIRLVPAFFEGIVHRYMNASHYWPDREITKDTRREHLSAWYSLYLMLLVANETQDKIAATLRQGVFERDPGMLKAGGPALVDRLKKDRVLNEEAHQFVHIKRAGQADAESLTFPAYMDRWEAGIRKAYAVSPSP